MSAITLWSRLEPRPRTDDLASTLAARVRDPLWFLTRQWQVGEFHGEDCGSPAYAAVSASTGELTSWQAGQTTAALPASGLLEREIEAEPVTPDLFTRVEVGRVVEQLLVQHGLGTLLQPMRDQFALPPPAGPLDPDVERVRAACLGRVVDGIAFHAAAVAANGWPPTAPAPPDPGNAAAAVTELRAWVTEVWGTLGTAAPAAWDGERLEYRATVDASAPGGTLLHLDAHADARGDMDWYAFDVGRTARTAGGQPPTLAFEVMPTRARFRGMANARWWEIESSVMDLGSIRADLRDVAKLVVVDFMVVAANDWYVIPLEFPVGTLCAIDSLVVHDVFGGSTTVERADAGATEASAERWSMYSTTAAQGAISPLYLLPAVVATAAQDGPILEDVRIFRDETANLVWAVEQVTQNELGAPRPGHERTLARRSPSPPPPATAGLRYRLQTDVPEHWIPFVPVLIDAVTGDIVLERAALLRATAGGGSEPIHPVGRILAPDLQPYRIREEEVPREGVRIIRRCRRCRGVDGSTTLWEARMVLAGRGEGSSGLRFDLATTQP